MKCAQTTSEIRTVRIPISWMWKVRVREVTSLPCRTKPSPGLSTVFQNSERPQFAVIIDWYENLCKHFENTFCSPVQLY